MTDKAEESLSKPDPDSKLDPKERDEKSDTPEASKVPLVVLGVGIALITLINWVSLGSVPTMKAVASANGEAVGFSIIPIALMVVSQ